MISEDPQDAVGIPNPYAGSAVGSVPKDPKFNKPCNYGFNYKKKDTCQYNHEPSTEEITNPLNGSCFKIWDHLMCERVKCKPHFLKGTDILVTLGTDVYITQGKTVTHAVLVNGDTQILVVTGEQEAYLFNLHD